tara:strand:- start:428 stop:1597 length:1170 start_codon:yes stop_codon:yes gene_type:complete
MRILKSLFKIFFSFLILFIIINFFIAFFWEYRTNKKFANFNPYSKTVLNLLDLDENQARQLYIETWIDRKYEYDQFVEWSEGYQKDKKFVNITKDGRKITNNKDCKKNFYFYGGSTTFGYNVTDYQTFAQYFKDILEKEFGEKNFCVFNHGRAGFASPWETILFQKHLEQNRIKTNDFVFFIDGVNERGLTDGINTELLKLYQNAATYDYWDIYKPTSSIFLQSLPFTQLVMRIKQKKRLGSKDLNSVNCPIDTTAATIGPKLICLPDQEVAKTLETFLKIRNSVCNEFDINCYTMLQPYASIHGKYFEKYEKSPAPETGMLKDVSKNYEAVIGKYDNLKKINGIIDISGSLDNETTISFVDRSHYSPAANKAIAKYIFSLIKDELYEK